MYVKPFTIRKRNSPLFYLKFRVKVFSLQILYCLDSLSGSTFDVNNHVILKIDMK